MSGFSPEWLALREPIDHRSRAPALAASLRAAFARHDTVGVVDLGCGTGSNLRGTAPLLPRQQSWTLVDYEPRLLAAARVALAAWADRSEPAGDGLVLHKADRRITVTFRQVDLNRDLDGALSAFVPDGFDLVTASAFFDLGASEFIARFVQAVARRRAHFYTVLTYNGDQRWTPADAADAEMAAAFHAHQRTDKGFGPAAGPTAAAALAAAFRAAGYDVAEGDSPWVLGPADQALIDDLAQGFAGAVGETAAVDAARVAAWRAVRRTGAVVGHTDTLAVPRG